MSRTGDVQVGEQFYDFSSYSTLPRWISYWHQVDAVMRAGATKVLEIGAGGGVTTDILRKAGREVTTFDFDAATNPDVVGDIRQLAARFPDRPFDCVCAFQVLEHLPFGDFETVLAQLALVSRKHVLISLPHHGYGVDVAFRFSRPKIDFGISGRVSLSRPWRFDGQHYWEIGVKGVGLPRVRAAIEQNLEIDRAYFCPGNSYHYFFEGRVR